MVTGSSSRRPERPAHCREGYRGSAVDCAPIPIRTSGSPGRRAALPSGPPMMVSSSCGSPWTYNWLRALLFAAREPRHGLVRLPEVGASLLLCSPADPPPQPNLPLNINAPKPASPIIGKKPDCRSGRPRCTSPPAC